MLSAAPSSAVKNGYQVRVDEILEAPSILAQYNGRTIQVVAPISLKAGRTAVFRASGYEFGETLTAHVDSVEEPADALVSAGGPRRDARAAAAARRMRERMQGAELVVAGMVESVQLPEEVLTARALTASSGSSRADGPLSEHDPQWRHAVVRIDRLHKGNHRDKKVVVTFAASDDVRWFKAPKLQPGQRQVIALHRTDEAAPATKRGATMAAGRPRYAALDRADVQPLEAQEEIAQLFSAAPAAVAAGGVRTTRTAKRSRKART
ncbi:MAG TPA: hypothetical protein VN914_21620 [Polyangia bacterium]|nr:hypothetical protein [Polyangia bacterium]